MKIERGDCVKVECDGEEIGLMKTDWGWALVEPTGERERNVAMRVIYVDPVPVTVFVTTRNVVDPAPVMVDDVAFIRTRKKWDDLP